MATRPNILIIKSDQHNARCLGVNGHAQVRTPNLDALAQQGVNFTQAYVQNPICSPSRMCYLTGQYTHNHGVYGLSGNEQLPAGLPSQMSVMQAAGYRTGIIGHIHVQDAWLQPSCDQYRNLHEETVASNGLSVDDAYSRYLAAKDLLDKRDDEAWHGHAQFLDACPSELSFEDSYEGYCAQSFAEFLRETPAGQPFLYQIDCLHPHENYIPVQEFWDMYEGMELELPPSVDEDLTGKPPPQQWMVEWMRSYKGIFEPKGYEHVRRRKLQGYYGCISQVDHMVGEVRRLLQERGLAENTIVIYCSDHGEFALEHGFLEKAPGISYDAVLRTPFIWAWPGGGFAQGTVEELVESIDLFPTLCKLTGVPAPDTVDGLDISPMLYGKKEPVREAVYAEFPWSRTIRTREWKLCHRPAGMYREGVDDSELYHVTDDPWEMTNLNADPRYAEVREELRRQLFDWLLRSTRYGNTWPHLPQGTDGKTHPAEIENELARGGAWTGAYL
ncbi:MAG: sulfatase family protein [Armatimonadota bacterium]